MSAKPARASKSASKRRPIEIGDLFALRLPGSPALAPDGRSCVVTVQRCDTEKNRYHSNLYLVDTESGDARAITEGDHSDSQPLWSPDGRALAFVSSRSETAQVHVMPVGIGD